MIKLTTMLKILQRAIRVLVVTVTTAVVLVSSAGESFTNPYTDLLSQAITLFRSGKIDESISKINEIDTLGLEDGAGMAYFLKGHCFVKKDDNEKALEYFEKAANGSSFPLQDYAVFSLARTHYKTGKKDLAETEYEKLILEHPDSALAPKSMFFLACQKAEKGDDESAIEMFDLIIYSPEQGELVEEAKYRKGKSLEALGRYNDAANTYFNLAFYHMKGPYRKLAMDKMHYLQRKHGIPFPAATAQTFFDRAMSFYNAGDYPSASAELYRFLKYYSDWELRAQARLRLGVSEYKRRRYSNSFYHLKKVIKAGSRGADEAQFYLSFIYGRWGNLRNTLTSLRKVLWKHPESEFCDDAAFYIGYYYDINGFKSKAIQEYESFLDKYPESYWATDAVWRAGKIHYAMGDYEKAFKTFSKASDEFPPDELSAHCIFWRGMSALKTDKRNEAKDSFMKVVNEFDHTYHSYQAREKLKWMGVREDEIEYEEIKTVKNFEEADPTKYRILMSLGFYDHARNEAAHLRAKSSEDNKLNADLLYYLAVQRKGDYRTALRFAEGRYLDAINDGEMSQVDYRMWQLAYPRGFWSYVLKYSVEYNLDPYLVLAVIREESRFNPKTVSWARAHGLMQIIPSTARGIARFIGIRPYYLYRLFEPETNIKMGCYYLSQLIKRFNGNPYLALAGYNGGPMRVKAWLSRWKRENGQYLDIDEFVESIPFKETRRYVKKVMKSYNEYKRIYESSNTKPLPSSQG